MEFSCAACDKTYAISPRAFGPLHDTRTRCPNCKTWLIITRSPDESTTAVIDPAVAASQQSLADSISGQLPFADARRPSTSGHPQVQRLPSSSRHPQVALPPEPDTAAQAKAMPAFGLHPSAPTAVDPARPHRQHTSSGFERLDKGLDLFALPDPATRHIDRSRRAQIGQVLQDFSMMVRLDTVKTDRKRQAAIGLVLLAVGAGIWWAVQQKMGYDAQVDAAKESKKLTMHWILQSAEGEFVPVLAQPGDPTPVDGIPKQYLMSALGRQIFYKARPAAKPK
ncbi:MAG: hypothetical protein EXR77_06575 [Myxococcales bacterium]|nr:hypothetical protein [Myxococcales bacterium]